MAVVDVKDFDVSYFDQYQIIPKLKRKKGSKDILNVITAFDIESTRLEEIEQSVMFIWQWQIGPDLTVIGRSWEDWLAVLRAYRDRFDAWLIIYVHNLSYEFSFLKGIYDFQRDEVFCMEARKILKCTMFDIIEYRCSYLLTNMSLDKFLKKFQVENKKLTFDYNKRRFPWTKLSEEEMAYCINDVKGLVQALKKQMVSDGDDLQTIPLTATGYVRRDVKAAMRRFNHDQLHEMMPSTKVYRALREAFRGGDTLSNRWNTDQIIENIRSCDIVSSYPSSMLMNQYPMSRFILEDPRDFDKLYQLGSKALLFRVVFIGLKLKRPTLGHAYLSRDKCRDIEDGVFANGRILRADYLETTITDVDYEIITRRYTWQERYIFKLWSANYGMLPLELRKVIMDYYRVKTKLKGVPEGTDEYLFYMKNKEKLNSTYGMTVEAIKDEIYFEDGEFKAEDKPLADLVRRHNAKAFLNYAWGVWTTCWSRKRLADGIDVVTADGDDFNFIYSDTDSIKYVGDADFGPYNARIEKEALKTSAYAADRNGEVHYMGVYEDEGYRLPNRFKTMGAKKYVLEDPDKKLHITIAGVNKRLGGEELGTLDNFKEGFIFKKAGGTESIFNDDVDMEIEIDSHKLHISDNMVIRDSTYTLGITAEYRKILDGLINIKYSDHDIPGLYKVKD